jgi:hypothetical protein
VSNGPTVTSPANTSILLYQYAPMTPIQFSATGTGTIYFFVRDAELPLGLTFNSVTNTLSGTPMRIGNTTVTIYVKDSIGVTLLTLQFRVIIPVVERQQTSAGAWTVHGCERRSELVERSGIASLRRWDRRVHAPVPSRRVE